MVWKLVCSLVHRHLSLAVHAQLEDRLSSTLSYLAAVMEKEGQHAMGDAMRGMSHCREVKLSPTPTPTPTPTPPPHTHDAFLLQW